MRTLISAMYLETSDRRSLFHNRARQRFASSPRLRSARTPPPAFLFLPIHLSNSPGASLPPTLREPEEQRSPSSEDCRMAFHCTSEELQRRVIAAKRGGRRRWVVYRRRRDLLSTVKI